MLCLLFIQITLFIAENWIRLAYFFVAKARMVKLNVSGGWNFVKMMDRIK